MNTQNDNQPMPQQDEEYSLVDFWHLLVKRKALVLALPALSLLVAFAYLAMTPPTFESRAVIQVGQVGQVGQVETPAILVQRLKEQYRVDSKDVTNVMPRVTDISVDKKGASNVITILAQDHSAEGAQKYLTQVMQALLADHTKLYNQSMDVQRQRFQSLEKQMQALGDHTEKLSVYIEAVRKLDPAQAAILAIEKAKLLTEIPGLEREHTTLQLALSDIQSQPSKLLREPSLPVSQAKPKRTQMLALAGMLGLILGMVAALVAEFLSKVRQQIQKQAA